MILLKGPAGSLATSSTIRQKKENKPRRNLGSEARLREIVVCCCPQALNAGRQELDLIPGHQSGSNNDQALTQTHTQFVAAHLSGSTVTAKHQRSMSYARSVVMMLWSYGSRNLEAAPAIHCVRCGLTRFCSGAATGGDGRPGPHREISIPSSLNTSDYSSLRSLITFRLSSLSIFDQHSLMSALFCSAPET